MSSEIYIDLKPAGYALEGAHPRLTEAQVMELMFGGAGAPDWVGLTANTPQLPDALAAAADGEALFSEDVANDDLQPETADTWGFGMQFSPNEDLKVSLDYWDISYEDLIGVDEDDFIRRALAGEYQVARMGNHAVSRPQSRGHGLVVAQQ